MGTEPWPVIYTVGGSTVGGKRLGRAGNHSSYALTTWNLHVCSLAPVMVAMLFALQGQ